MKPSINFKEFMSRLYGEVTQTPGEALRKKEHEKEVEERKKHL